MSSQKKILICDPDRTFYNWVKFLLKDKKFNRVQVKVICNEMKCMFSLTNRIFVVPINSIGFIPKYEHVDYKSRWNNLKEMIKYVVNEKGRTSLLNRKFLPVSSTDLYRVDKKCTIMPVVTMYLPQDIRYTQNVYHCMLSMLSYIDGHEVSLIMPKLCCEPWIDVETCARQMIDGIMDWDLGFEYDEDLCTATQPLCYMNKEFSTSC